ncbi:hypothetical protein [Mucilaginibacter sp.]|jgi:hypothetical protein|uniref:hypothetical protein n=1 Tax=Mucilaginibacter sp. TaxID=1882438 RepID=UPI003568F22A
MLKRFFFFFTAIILTASCFAQETVDKKNRLTDNVSEIYKVLASNKYTKQGLYQAVFKKKLVVATGMFENDKKTGVWRFYDQQGQAMQIYDYTKKQLLFEAKEDTSSSLRYFVDKQLDSTSKVTKPVKVGGRYYGYLPYLNLFTVPKDLRDINYDLFSAVVELLISPYGRLADYKVHLNAVNFKRTINMNINLPNEEDMVFIPATLNGEPISSRVVIQCYVTNSGHLDFD